MEKKELTEKIRVLGAMAKCIGHDFNNVLSVVSLNLEYLRDLPNLPKGEVDECIEDVQAAVRSGAEILHRLSFFARVDLDKALPVDAGQLIEETGRSLRELIPDAITIEQQTQAGAVVIGDHDRLVAAVMALALNARDAMPDGGTLILAVEKDEGEVRIRVVDTGVGMDDDCRARAFEPFYAKQMPGKQRGVGLGLATVFQVVWSHGGRVELSSTEGKGTECEIVLPRAPVV